MTTKKIQALECKCERCGGTWIARATTPPVRCAKCGTPYWNIPRQGRGAVVVVSKREK